MSDSCLPGRRAGTGPQSSAATGGTFNHSTTALRRRRYVVKGSLPWGITLDE